MRRQCLVACMVATAMFTSCLRSDNTVPCFSRRDSEGDFNYSETENKSTPVRVERKEQPTLDDDGLRTESVLARCEFYERTRDWGAYRRWLTNLAAGEDYQALETISNSSLAFRSFACEEAVKHLPTPDAICYCRGLTPGSVNWRAAFLALRHHPKVLVMPYATEMVRHRDAAVRHAVYELGAIMWWDDFVTYANADKDDDSAVCVPNSEEVTLGIMASNYLKEIEEGRRRRREGEGKGGEGKGDIHDLRPKKEEKGSG